MSLPQGYLGYFFRSSSVLVASGKNSYLISSLGRRRERSQPGNGEVGGRKSKGEILIHNLPFSEPESMEKLPQEPHTNSASIPSLWRATTANRTGLELLRDPQFPAAGNFQELILIEHHLPQEPTLFLEANHSFKNDLFSALKTFPNYSNNFSVQLHYCWMNVIVIAGEFIGFAGEFIGLSMWVYSLFSIKCISTLDLHRTTQNSTFSSNQMDFFFFLIWVTE